jgi:hypothetical protein
MTPEEKRERQRAASRRYYWRHKEEEAERSKRWHERHPGYRTRNSRKFRAANPGYASEWADANREQVRAADKRHRDKDPESYRLRKCLAKRVSRAEAPERNAAGCRKWREKNRNQQ